MNEEGVEIMREREKRRKVEGEIQAGKKEISEGVEYLLVKGLVQPEVSTIPPAASQLLPQGTSKIHSFVSL